MNDDRDLHERFSALRRLESEAAPSLDALLGRRVARSRRPLAVLVATTALVALAIGLAVRSHRPTPAHPAPSLLAWTAPTDFLLETPGHELFDSIPALGTSMIPTASPPGNTATTRPTRRSS